MTSHNHMSDRREQLGLWRVTVRRKGGEYSDKASDWTMLESGFFPT